MTRWLRFVSLAVLCSFGSAETPADGASAWRGGTAERVAAERAIEEVLYRHRIWPAENRSPKPDFADAVPESVSRAQVDDVLRKTAALESLWHHPITHAQLQEEIGRMARASKDLTQLAKLWSALGNDTERIAECLARPIVVDRLLRGAYASDTHLHADVQRRAEAALAHSRSVTAMREMGGDYREVVYRKSGATPSVEAGTMTLEEDEWQSLVARLAVPFRTPRRAHSAAENLRRLPLGVLSPLEERREMFAVHAVLAKSEDRLVVASVNWFKRSFEDWWAEARRAISPQEPPALGSYSLPDLPLPSTSCTPDTWSEMDAEFPAPRNSHTAVWTGAEMIVWGGSDTRGVLGDGSRYRPSTDSWTPVSLTDAPSARAYHTAVWTGTRMIVWGGTGGTVETSDFNSGGLYDPATDTWSTTTPTGAPSARGQHTAVWTGTLMIAWGGFDAPLGQTFNSGGRYDPVTDSWTPVTLTSAPGSRTSHTAIWTGTRMIVWGGLQLESGPLVIVNTGGRYDPTTDSWTATRTSTAPSPRELHSAVWTGDEMIVWGGEANSIFLANGARYNPQNDQWNPISGAGAPTSRALHSAVWTGSDMVVWGGVETPEFFPPATGGGRYHLATDVWAPLPAGGPSARQSHSAVWTGTEMIVWGGFDSSGAPTDTGARYSPTSNLWTATASSDRPPLRRGHTLLWTGSEMIMWGGTTDYASADNLLSGARYLPATDSWTLISTLGQPTRNFHSAVWTGSEMIVWGGYAPGGPGPFAAGGGRYNPTLDSWQPTSTNGEPPPRAGHSSIWSGSQVIIWGGHNGLNSPRDDGGRYDPVLNAWTATTTIGAPSARRSHAAVWNGREMIVWGGSANSLPAILDAERYDPLTDTWTSVSDSGLPPGGLPFLGVWTGREMVALQVQDHSPALAARYDPGLDEWTLASGPGIDARDGTWLCGQVMARDLAMNVRSYDPSVDAWVSGAQGPQAEWNGPMVSTGNQLILWNGSSKNYAYCGCGVPAAAAGPTWALRSSVHDGAMRVSWNLDPDAASYDVVRGSLGVLRATHGDFAAATDTCLAQNTWLTWVEDLGLPTSDDGFWYLVRPRNGASHGTYDSGYPSQVGLRDPEIAASGADCP